MSLEPPSELVELVVLRPALDSDCGFVWRVNNQRSVREQSIHTQSIPYEAHRAWYVGQLGRRDREILIASSREEPVGVVRYEVDSGPSYATISIAVDERHRGRGFGRQMIQLVADRVFEVTAVHTLRAQVRPANVGSIKAFRHAGFALAGNTVVSGVPLLVFERLRASADGG